MSDQDDFGQTLTPSQEHTVAFIVILLFGLMYWHFTHDSQRNTVFSNQSTMSLVPSSAKNTISVPDENHLINPSNRNTEATVSSSSNNISARSKVVSNELGMANKKPQEAADVPITAIKEERREIAADQKSFNAQGMEVTNGIKELVIPSKVTANRSSSNKKTLNLSEELNRVSFYLPDGRMIKIPSQGFEQQFKKLILQDSSRPPLILDSVSFYPGSDRLNPESSNQILGIAGILHTYSDVKIKLRGHTDNTGPLENNLTLSFKRSLNLKRQLVGLGINTQRIQIEGIGASEPISENDSEQGRNKNRRIDLTIIR